MGANWSSLLQTTPIGVAKSASATSQALWPAGDWLLWAQLGGGRAGCCGERSGQVGGGQQQRRRRARDLQAGGATDESAQRCRAPQQLLLHKQSRANDADAPPPPADNVCAAGNERPQLVRGAKPQVGISSGCKCLQRADLLRESDFSFAKCVCGDNDEREDALRALQTSAAGASEMLPRRRQQKQSEAAAAREIAADAGGGAQTRAKHAAPTCRPATAAAAAAVAGRSGRKQADGNKNTGQLINVVKLNPDDELLLAHNKFTANKRNTCRGDANLLESGAARVERSFIETTIAPTRRVGEENCTQNVEISHSSCTADKSIKADEGKTKAAEEEAKKRLKVKVKNEEEDYDERSEMSAATLLASCCLDRSQQLNNNNNDNDNAASCDTNSTRLNLVGRNVHQVVATSGTCGRQQAAAASCADGRRQQQRPAARVQQARPQQPQLKARQKFRKRLSAAQVSSSISAAVAVASADTATAAKSPKEATSKRGDRFPARQQRQVCEQAGRQSKQPQSRNNWPLDKPKAQENNNVPSMKERANSLQVISTRFEQGGKRTASRQQSAMFASAAAAINDDDDTSSQTDSKKTTGAQSGECRQQRSASTCSSLASSSSATSSTSCGSASSSSAAAAASSPKQTQSYSMVRAAQIKKRTSQQQIKSADEPNCPAERQSLAKMSRKPNTNGKQLDLSAEGAPQLNADQNNVLAMLFSAADKRVSQRSNFGNQISSPLPASSIWGTYKRSRRQNKRRATIAQLATFNNNSNLVGFAAQHHQNQISFEVRARIARYPTEPPPPRPWLCRRHSPSLAAALGTLARRQTISSCSFEDSGLDEGDDDDEDDEDEQVDATSAKIFLTPTQAAGGLCQLEMGQRQEEQYRQAELENFTVFSYNVLSDRLVNSERFPSSPNSALDWTYRRELILAELLKFNADIIALQELEMEQFEEYFKPKLFSLASYESVFEPKSRAKTMDLQMRRRVDGCAIFYKSNRFKLVQTHLFEFSRIAMANARGSEAMLNRVMTKDNIGLAAILEFIEPPGVVAPNDLVGAAGSPEAAINVFGRVASGGASAGEPPQTCCGGGGGDSDYATRRRKRLLVCNTHIHWDPECCDVKLIQTIMLMNELECIARHYSSTAGWPISGAQPGGQLLACAPTDGAAGPQPPLLPLVLLGDFNSLPESGVTDYLAFGKVNSLHADFKGFKYTSCTNALASAQLPAAAVAPTCRRAPPAAQDANHVLRYEHPFELASVYNSDTMPYTNYTTEFKATIDYIFYTRNSIELLGLLGAPDKNWLATNQIDGFPQPFFPSDHLPLMAEMRLCDAASLSSTCSLGPLAAGDEELFLEAVQADKRPITPIAKRSTNEAKSVATAVNLLKRPANWGA